MAAAGGYNFAGSDLLIGLSPAARLRLFGHTPVWPEERHPLFQQLRGRRAEFERRYRDYVRTVVERYRGGPSGRLPPCIDLSPGVE